jgi:hypothetical protein
MPGVLRYFKNSNYDRAKYISSLLSKRLNRLRAQTLPRREVGGESINVNEARGDTHSRQSLQDLRQVKS